MIDKKIDKSVEDTKAFMELWIKFFDIVSLANRENPPTKEEESDFLKVKSDIARKHQQLMTSLGADYNFDQGLMNLVGQSVSISSLATSSDVALKKLENEWHRCYISINETLGALEQKQETLLHKSSMSAATEGFGKIFKSPGFIIILIIAIIVVLFIFVQPVKDIAIKMVAKYKEMLR